MDIQFTPVKVERGRKFKGRGFLVDTVETTGDYGWKHTAGYGWSRNIVHTENAKIWVPNLKRHQYANFRYVEDDETVTPEECQVQLAAYIDHIISDTLAWCRSKKPTDEDNEIRRFARNVLRKNHPGISEEILEKHGLGDQRDISAEIEKTLKWAMNLTTRSCVMYGRHCAGGRPLPIEKKLAIANKAFERKGLTAAPDFDELLKFHLTCMGLLKTSEL